MARDINHIVSFVLLIAGGLERTDGARFQVSIRDRAVLPSICHGMQLAVKVSFCIAGFYLQTIEVESAPSIGLEPDKPEATTHISPLFGSDMFCRRMPDGKPRQVNGQIPSAKMIG